MTSPEDSATIALVTAQTGRRPRSPWRVAVRCSFGHPAVIASPATLEDGTPFPTLYWLTCPHLAEKAAAEESEGATARWAARAGRDERLAIALRAADAAVRSQREQESGGEDPCAEVGLAGQRDPLGVKCLHAHVALFLAGIEDPIGAELVSRAGRECQNSRCRRLAMRLADEGPAPVRGDDEETPEPRG